MTKTTTDRGVRASRRGFTLIEAIVVIVILGVLAAVIAPRFLSRIGQSKQSLAASNASSLVSAMRTFIADHGDPEEGASIDILYERPSGVSDEAWDPYVEKADDLLDPWGNKYILVVPGKVNRSFDIVSYGRDGKPGGEGEDADIVKP